MYRRKQTHVINYLMAAAIISTFLIMILSAVAASSMYTPAQDAFTASLTENLSLLCKNGDYGLSETQLSLIKNAEVSSIRYDEDSDGNRLFSAKLKLSVPQANAGKYSGNPSEYLQNTADRLNQGSESEEIEIIGLCRDNMPVVDIETLERIADTADNVWQKQTLISDRNFEYAVIDMLIPEPFTERVYSDQAAYQSGYDKWLTDMSEEFASEGFTVNKDGERSGNPADIREAMASVITPYLCSVRNISLAASSNNKGMLTLSFDTLDIIGTIYSAKKPTISALNKLSGVYTDERSLKVSIEFDLCDLISDKERNKLPFFDLIRAITSYGSSIGYSAVKIKTPTESQIIDGKSNGQWPVAFVRKKGDGDVIVDVIKLEDSGEETSVVKLFLTDGGKTTVCLAKGSYRLNMAVGSVFYGGKEYFGVNGIYMRDTENIYVIPSIDTGSITVAKQPGEALSFTEYMTNLSKDKSLIERSQF